jgi:hypothetical protein
MTEKAFRKSAPKPGDWRRELAVLMREERKLRELQLSDYPKFGGYQDDVENARQVPDLGYLLRLMIWYRQKGIAIPSRSRLRAILICWALARLEAVPEGDTFREHLITDYAEITKPSTKSPAAKDAFKKTVAEVFTALWPERGGPEAQEYIREMIGPIYKEIIGHKPLLLEQEPLDQRLPTLDRFPEAFQPLVVIVGGYFGKIGRDPDHISDLFRQSQNVSNLHYLLRLNLPPETEIVSDRLLLELHDDPERADELLGSKHVLVIGSPLVNVVSRHLVLNKKLIFNFVFNKQAYLLGKNFYDDMIKSRLFENLASVVLLRKLMDARTEEFEEISSRASEPSSLDKARIEKIVLSIRQRIGAPEANHDSVTDLFRPSNIFSPFSSLLLHAGADTNHQHGVISLGENIWSKISHGTPKHALVFVGGTHELSTAIALRDLSAKEALVDYPLGGILETISGNAPGPKRVTGVGSKWITEKYQAHNLLNKIDRVLETFADVPSANTLFDTQTELEDYRDMVAKYL